MKLLIIVFTAFQIFMNFSVVQNLNAQPGSNDPTFNFVDDCSYGEDQGFDLAVYTSVHIGGKTILGGDFTSYRGTAINRIVRINSTGSLDASFNIGTGFNGVVYSISVQQDGKLIIGGSFGSFNGTPINNIVRLNTNGSLDVSFNPGTGFNNTVYTTSVQMDGKIIVGGNFTNFNGSSRNFIARLNANGSLDVSFNPNTGFGSNVRATAIQTDGKVIVGGNFSTYNGVGRNKIARLNSDGSLDITFNPGTGFSSLVWSTSIQADGKIIVGGDFFSFNGLARNRIVRLNTDGTVDNSFNTGTGFSNSVITTNIQTDGKIIVGGNYTSFNTIPINRIARLNTDGSIDTSFNSGSGFNITVFTTCLQADGKIIVGGSFNNFNSLARDRLARLNTDGSLDISGFNNSASDIAIQPDGKIIVGGSFTTFYGASFNRIARLNTDGSLDTSFNTGSGFDNDVRTIAIQSDGKIIAGGSFTSYNGVLTSGIARLNTDGTLDTSFNTGSGFYNGGAYYYIETIAIQSDGKIIAGGSFTSYNGGARNRIVRINLDGSLDALFNPGTGLSSSAQTSSIQPDGKIIVGGTFTSFNGIARSRIVRINLDGSLDASFNPSLTLGNTIFTVLIQPDGKIIAGGSFVFYCTPCRPFITRYNTDGSVDSTFNYGTGFNGSVVTTSLQPDGKIVIGGYFTSFNGVARNRIARLNTDGSLDYSFNPISGFNGPVSTTAIQTDGKIIAGGDFTTIDDTCRSRIARLRVCNSTAAANIVTTCGSFTWLNGITYTTNNNTANLVIQNAVGCDSIITLNLTILQPSSSALTQSVCSSYSLNGQTYTSSGNYSQTITNAAGCDSTITLNLTILQPSSSALTQSACSSYAINGQTYTSSGTYTQIRSNSAGCDSTITLNLTIRQPSSSTLTQSACSSYTLNGQTYSTSGSYIQTLTNALGCDSIITLNLTLNQSSSALTQSSCNNYTLNGQTYTSSGSYTQVLTNAAGCDSTIILNLTISQPSSSTITQTTCSTYALNGQTYTSSGTYTQVWTNAAGCDSTITLNLTLLQPSSSTITQTACSSFILNGQTYNSSGTYTQVRTNAASCDSTITLNLTINQNPTASVTSTPVSVIGGSDGSINITVSGGSAPYAYSWSNGSNSEDLNGLSTGIYTVTVVDVNNCSFVLSETVANLPLSIIMEGNSITADIFPNPAETKVSLYVKLNTVSDEVILNIYNPLGIRLSSKSYQNIKEISDEIDIAEFPAGMYIFEINVSEQNIIKKLVKK